MTLPPAEWMTLAVVAVLCMSAFSRSAFGFGDALISMPLLALMLPVRTTTPLVGLMALLSSSALLIWQWRHVHWSDVRGLLVGSVAGAPFGLWLLHAGDDRPLKVILALVVIGFALWRLLWVQRTCLHSSRSAPAFGLGAGVLVGAYNTGGPPIVIYGSLRGWNPRAFRASLQSIFLVNGLVVVSGHGLTGLWTPTVLGLFVIGLVPVLLALLIGHWAHRRIHPEHFHRAIHILLLIIGVMLLVRTIIAW